MPPDIFSFLNTYVPISKEDYKKLTLYHDLLLKWQNRINLVSDESIGDIWRRHFLDSLQLILYIGKNKKIVDMGSGSGFPGMVLAIASAGKTHLIESDSKKAAFLTEVSRVTETPVHIHHSRCEETKISDVDVVTARALSDLKKLFSYSIHFISHETICLFPKGKNYAMEIEDAKTEWRFEYDILPSVTDNEAVILKIFNLTRR